MCVVLSSLLFSSLLFSRLVLSCLVLSSLVLSCLVLSCLCLSGLVLSCLVLSCLVWSCVVLSCLVLSRLSCLVWSGLTTILTKPNPTPNPRAYLLDSLGGGSFFHCLGPRVQQGLPLLPHLTVSFFVLRSHLSYQNRKKETKSHERSR